MRNNVQDFLDFGGLADYPESIWLQDGTLEWTFSHFNALINKIGSALIARKVPVGDVVAVVIPNGASVLAADFGVLRAGAAFMNVDVSLPTARLMSLLSSVKPKFVIYDEDSKFIVPEELQCIAVTYAELLSTELNELALQKRRLEVIDTDPACLIPTSGSTGTPKAVALTHRGLVDFGCWFDKRFTFCSDDIVGSLSPLFFDGYIPGLLMSLQHGSKFVILPREAAAFPLKLVEKIKENKITFIFWVPSTLVPIAKFDVLSKISLPKLKFIGFAGEVMPPTTLAYMREKLPWATFVNFYGPIEISVICSYFVVPADFPDDLPVPIGYPCENSRIIVLNEDDNVCDVGEVGEICVLGSCLALGYWNDEDKTNSVFVKNPMVNSFYERMYRTGDLGTFASDGCLSFVGRKDFQIKHQGYRIDLGEIEHVADVSLDAKSCCVIYDKNTKNIVLYYDAEGEMSLKEVRTKIGMKLPKYMLPTHSVRVSPMPLNPNGKIDRKLLTEKHFDSKG